MTKKDKELIEKAQSMHFADWMDILDMIPQAESDEAKQKLTVIKQRKYHKEEYKAWML